MYIRESGQKANITNNINVKAVPRWGRLSILYSSFPSAQDLQGQYGGHQADADEIGDQTGVDEHQTAGGAEETLQGLHMGQQVALQSGGDGLRRKRLRAHPRFRGR